MSWIVQWQFGPILGEIIETHGPILDALTDRKAITNRGVTDNIDLCGLSSVGVGL